MTSIASYIWQLYLSVVPAHEVMLEDCSLNSVAHTTIQKADSQVENIDEDNRCLSGDFKLVCDDISSVEGLFCPFY